MFKLAKTPYHRQIKLLTLIIFLTWHLIALRQFYDYANHLSSVIQFLAKKFFWIWFVTGNYLVISQLVNFVCYLQKNNSANLKWLELIYYLYCGKHSVYKSVCMTSIMGFYFLYSPCLCYLNILFIPHYLNPSSVWLDMNRSHAGSSVYSTAVIKVNHDGRVTVWTRIMLTAL